MADNLVIKSIVTDNRITAQFSDKYLPRYARYGELFVVNGILYIYANLDDSGHGRWFPLTDQKEIFTYEQTEAINRWIIPIEFHTDNIQIIVYDDEDKIYRENFTVNIDNMQIEIVFDEPTSGQVYIIINKAFDWVDEKFIVADKNFAVTQDNDDPQKYYIEINTEYIEVLKNGNTTFRRDVNVEGELNVTGTTVFNGNQQIDGSVSISQDLNIGGTLTVVNDLIANLNTHIKADLQVDGNAVIDGNLTVKGTTTSIQTEEIKLDDNIITLNSNAVGIPTQNAGIEVARGDSEKVTIIQWDEINDATNIPNDTIISGNVQIDGNTNIDGNLTIQGENVDIATTTLTVEDNIITINKGFTGLPVNNVGLEIDRGDSGILPLLTFNEASDFVTIPVKQQNGSFLQDEIAGKVYTLNEIDKEKSRAINEETILTNRVSTLETTVSTGDSNLQTQLTNEIANRISSDNILQTNIDDEITRSISTENTLRSDLTNETNERETTDNSLQAQVTSEIASRLTNDSVLQASINTEKARAEGIETTLQTQINNEITRAHNTEGDLVQLSTTDKTNLVNAINEEMDRAISAETDISNDLLIEVNNRLTANNTLQTNINTEISNRTSADNILQGKIDTETTNRISAVTGVQTNLTTETQRATTAEAVIFNKFVNYVSKITTVAQEINSDLTVNENVIIKKNLTVEGETSFVNTTTSEIENNKVILNANITTGTPSLDASVTVLRGDEGENTIVKWYENGNDSEVQISEWDTDTLQFVNRRIATKIYVDDELSNINNALDERITILESDNSVSLLTTNLTNEINRATDVEGDLTQLDTTIKTDLVEALNSEVARAISSETILTTNLNAEISRSVSKDNALELELDNEVSRALSKDNELELTLTNEISRATLVEGDISTLTTSNKTSLTNAINSLKALVDNNNTTQSSTVSSMFTKTGEDIIFKGNLIPETDSLLNIGSSTNKISELYVSANTIYLGDNTIINELGLHLLGGLSASTLNATTITADNIYDKTTVDTILTGVETDLTAAITALEFAHNALVETVSTDSVSKTVTTAQSISSDVSFLGNITVQGSVNIIGNQTSSTVVNLSIENNEIILNDGTGSENEPYLDAMLSVDRGNKGIQPILKWKELGVNSAVLVPYIDVNGDIIEDEVVTSNTLTSAITTVNNLLSESLTTETNRAITVENTLSTNLTNEVNRAKGVEGVLSSLSIKLQDTNGILPPTLVQAINREVSRAYLAESTLTTNLNNEISRTTGLFDQYSTELLIESARAIVRENAIETALNTESTRAKAAETTLTNAVTTERTRAQLKENTLTLDLSNEISRASGVEIGLQNQINTIVSSMSTDVERLAAIQAVTTAFENADATLTSSITSLNNTATTNLNNEVTRATNVETTISTNLTGEINRAKSVEGTLISLHTNNQTNLVNAINEVHTDGDNEVTRAINAENVLTTNLNNEISRATLAETTLQNNINVEINRASSAETILTNNLNSEIVRATGVETTLQNNIDVEESSRIASDTTLQNNINVEKGRIDAILLASTANADSFAEIVTLINSVDTTSDTAFASYVTSNDARSTTIETNLSNEITRSTNQDVILQTNIDNEESSRIAADTTLQNNINVEKVRIDAILSASEADKDSFAEIVALINSIDTANDSAFASYVSSNNSRSTTIETNLSAEISRSTLSESTLQTNIDSESSARINADLTLQTNIDNEESNRIASDTILQTNIDNEESNRIASDTLLQTNIDSEELSRITADTTLQNNINVEKSRIDAILSSSEADKDSFAEIVALINSIDTSNDSTLAGYVISNNEAIDNILDGTTPVAKANTLTNSRTIYLAGDVTGSVLFDGSSNVTLTTTVVDDSHDHIISNIDGLQTALDNKQAIGIYNTIIGTSDDLTTDDAVVINSINVTDGVITSMDTRTLTLLQLGYTGDTDANNYVHPISNGNKHIPADGAAGQILRWSEEGTAVWGDDINTWRGISDSISTTSSTISASLTAVKTVYDLANHTHPYAALTGNATINFNTKSLIASESVKAPIFYDSANLAYYADFANADTSINCAGAIIATGDVVAYSDSRLKDNVEIIPDALNKVLGLNGVTFTRNDLDDTTRRHTGVIAQDVEKVLPEAVNIDANGMKSVAYGNMVGILIEAIKEQQNMINDLKNELKLLKGE